MPALFSPHIKISGRPVEGLKKSHTDAILFVVLEALEAKYIHRTGIEPVPLAWKASMITTSPSVFCTGLLLLRLDCLGWPFLVVPLLPPAVHWGQGVQGALPSGPSFSPSFLSRSRSKGVN